MASIYILEGGPDASRCQVNQTTGACSIRQGVSLADKGNSTIEIDVKEVVISGATAGATNTVRVVAPVAPAPLALAAVSITINESPLPGIFLGELMASGGTANYTYSAGAGNNGSISVSTSGALTTAISLGALATPSIWQYATSPSFTFPVSVSDGVTTATATVTINLNQVATAPPATNASISISEALATGTEIASPTNFGITAADFTLATISGNNAFLIHPTTGVITLNTALDALVVDSYSRFVTFAKDVNGQALSSSPSLTIAVLIANRAPTIGITGAVASLPEATSTTSAVTVGAITITEIDGGQGTNVLEISGADAASFELGTPTTVGAVTSYPLRLKAGTELDFSIKTSYSITITSSDAALPGQDKSLNYSLAISNSNVAPIAPAIASFDVPDNLAIDALVGTVTVSDPGDTITASVQIDDPTSPGIFAVSDNGEIRVAQTIPLAITQDSHEQTIRWTDSRGLFVSTVVTYNISAASRIANATYSVDEDELIGFTIATLPSTFNGNALTYAITAGDDNNQFEFNANSLIVADLLDYESQATYTLTVTATEIDGTDTATITINVQDVPESVVALSFAAQGFSIAENSANGTTIGTLAISGGTPPYSFAESPASTAIAVHPTTGVLTVQDSAQFDHEVNPTLTVTVIASDSSSPAQSITQTITVNVTDVPPSFTLSATTGNIDETANSESTLMATIIPTETVTPSYSLSGANAALFELTNGDSQLRLRSGQNLSTADGATRVVTVNLDDASTGAGIDASQTFVLSVWVQGGGPGY
jgi:hypothetical protein